MPHKIDILSQDVVFKKAIFKIEEAKLRHERYDGTMSDVITRLNLERGDAVAAVLHDRKTEQVLLIEQFRYPTVKKGPGWLVEVAAGIIDGDESPETAMRREIEEETGYRVTQLKRISTFYLSPGGTSERIHLFYASIDRLNRPSKGGGLAAEGEDIQEVVMSTADAYAKLDRGEFADAKTIIALQWMRLGNHNK